MRDYPAQSAAVFKVGIASKTKCRHILIIFVDTWHVALLFLLLCAVSARIQVGASTEIRLTDQSSTALEYLQKCALCSSIVYR